MPAIPKRLDPRHLGRNLTPEESLEVRARMMTERDLEQTVAAMARYRNLRRYHTHRSDRSPAGYPDDVLVGPRRILYAELKTELGRASVEQADWLDALGLVAATAPDTMRVRLYRPSDLLAGRIDADLAWLAA